ncbi:MAG: helix-turn-helix transcriptional regulator [Candidatus Competibacteraceae bacterium]|jgi:AraC-like DNA-binding protein|nr:helix-turn-helix transcriptional regulator [Candidatus Competibacteraceae bacterium]
MAHFKNHPVYSTNSLDDLSYVLKRFAPAEKLEITEPGKELDFTLRLVQVGRLQLYHISLGDDVPVRASAEPDENGEFSLVALTGGSGRARQHKAECDVSLDKGLMRDRRMPFLVHEHGFSAFLLSCSSEILEEHACSLIGGSSKRKKLIFDFEVDFTKPRARHLLNTLHFLADEIDDPSFDFENKIVMGNWENVLLSQLFLAQPNNYTDLLRTRSTLGVLPYNVKRARDHIHAHAHESITLKDLASSAGCGYRALQMAFNDAFGLSPMTYLKTVRLTRAREALLTSDGSTTVADVAKQWGFSDLGRFSQSYRLMFGELPSETLRKRA